MNTTKNRRRITKQQLGVLSESLRPIRSFQEVSQIMNLSITSVSKLENSALRKIIMALNPPSLDRRRKK
jgi:hypothetical protein